jgi:hypothetical protein
LDEFQGKENEDGSISRSYRSYAQGAWDSALAPGSPGIYERATSALLVPYILAVKAEGFGFNYSRWQQVNDATREQRQQLEAAVAAADAQKGDAIAFPSIIILLIRSASSMSRSLVHTNSCSLCDLTAALLLCLIAF